MTDGSTAAGCRGMRITERQIALVEGWEREIARAKAAGHTALIVKVTGKKPKPMQYKTRVWPGVMGRLVQWGDGTDRMPTMADVQVADLERFIAKCRAEIDATTSASTEEATGR